jgi:hypothetical protein
MVFGLSLCLFSIFILVAMSPVEVAGEKTVFLIRHAESEENRRISSLKKSVKNLGRLECQ